MNAPELLNQFLALADSEQKTFLSLLKGMGKTGPAKGAQQPNTQTGAQLLYEALSGAYRARTGVAMHPLAALRKGTAAEAYLDEALKWMSNGEELPRRTLVALCNLAAQTSVSELRAFGGHLNTREDHLRLLQRIPASMDRAFPSYRANNLLVRIAARASDGLLPINTEDD